MSNAPTPEELDEVFRIKPSGETELSEASRTSINTPEEAFDVMFSLRASEADRRRADQILEADRIAWQECGGITDELAALYRSRRGVSRIESQMRAKGETLNAVEKAATTADAMRDLRRVRDALLKESVR